MIFLSFSFLVCKTEKAIRGVGGWVWGVGGVGGWDLSEKNLWRTHFCGARSTCATEMCLSVAHGTPCATERALFCGARSTCSTEMCLSVPHSTHAPQKCPFLWRMWISCATKFSNSVAHAKLCATEIFSVAYVYLVRHRMWIHL